MSKKGFTLMELLAVIVILAVLALILTPIISGIIESSKKRIFIQNAYELMDTARLYQVKNLNNIEDITFTCDGTLCKAGEEILEFSGEVPKSGTITITKQSISSVEFLSNGKYCATGTKENLLVTIGCESTYTVNHYQIDEDGENYVLIDKEQFIGKIGKEVTPRVKEYVGFISPDEKTIIVEEYGNVVNYYYLRKEYHMEFDVNNNILTSEEFVSVNFGGKNTFDITINSGYYLSSITCTNGYTASANTGIEAIDTQTITILNNGNDNNSVCTFETEKLTSPYTGTLTSNGWTATYTDGTLTSCTRGSYSCCSNSSCSATSVICCTGNSSTNYYYNYRTSTTTCSSITYVVSWFYPQGGNPPGAKSFSSYQDCRNNMDIPSGAAYVKQCEEVRSGCSTNYSPYYTASGAGLESYYEQ